MKTSSLGDVIHNLPVVSDLKRVWPDVDVDWVVESGFADIPRLHPGVNRTIPVAVRRWRKQFGAGQTWHEIRAFLAQLRAREYDQIIDTQGLVKSALITRLARGSRCGYSRRVAREPLAALAYQCHFDIARGTHAVIRNRALVAAACGYGLDMPLSYGIEAPADVPAWLPVAPFAVLLTATSRDDKLWDEANWIQLGHALAERGIVAVLPSGNAREQSRAERLAQAISNAVAAPPSNITTLAAVLGRARLAIGVDTGLTHLAAALHVPTAAIFVATDPGLTGVYAPGHAFNLGTTGAPPSPEDVLAQMEPWLS
ncbi:lipopolysaccharide heptosyltransferase I [Uliginosibacterium sp. sgz301328]|uniref:lipopolysaccharide heptosyltransferase I n=1 Tax=Uliginosibacterium sp. sgz301328 TaxID=3243764 RepID=UPI00359D29F3